MSQEQNNLNSNQGNNGVPNNQSLNNQSINQISINAQPQQTSNFQQPMKMFENCNANNQNFEGKSPKKIKLGLIIGLVSVLCVVIIVGILLTTQFGKNVTDKDGGLNDNENLTENNNGKYKTVYNLIVNDVEYSFPLSFDELVNRGWKSHCSTTEEFGDMMMMADSSGSPNFNSCGMSNKDIIDITVIFSNETKNQQKVRDCDVIGFAFNNEENNIPKGSVIVKGTNGKITIGESTVDDVYNFFNGNYYYRVNGEEIYFDYDSNDVVSGITYVVYQ